jgi:hypothetical protein
MDPSSSGGGPGGGHAASGPDNSHLSLSYKHVFGVKTNVYNNCIHYADENKVVYPVGHTTVIYDIDHKFQRFFSGTEGAVEITCVAMSPNRRYLAVSERTPALDDSFSQYLEGEGGKNSLGGDAAKEEDDGNQGKAGKAKSGGKAGGKDGKKDDKKGAKGGKDKKGKGKDEEENEEEEIMMNRAAIVSIYDLHTMKKKKVCCYAEIDCIEIVSAAFDQNSKQLLTQYGVRRI